VEPSTGTKKAPANVEWSIVAKPRKDEAGEVRDVRRARSLIVRAVVDRGDRAALMMRSPPGRAALGHR
jgi:hypothetical protein